MCTAKPVLSSNYSYHPTFKPLWKSKKILEHLCITVVHSIMFWNCQKMFEEENRSNKPGRSLRTCRNHSNWVVQIVQWCLNGTSWKATFERHILWRRKVGTGSVIRDDDELEILGQTFAEINSIPSNHGLGIFWSNQVARWLNPLLLD